MESALFPDAGPAGVKLIETLGWNGSALVRADLHLARLAAGARALGYSCDMGAVRSALYGAGTGPAARLRLTLDAAGCIDITRSPMPPAADIWLVGIAAQRLHSQDAYLRFKTTHRPAYDAARASLPEGIDELILLNERGEVCDGTITTVFFDRGEGLRTPPLACGVLPGVLRQDIACPEEVIYPKELSGIDLWIGNSLRGLIKAKMVI